MARRAVVHGHVQGVFFRDTCRRLAVSLGLTGWVVNHEEDATVEVFAEGTREAVEKLIRWCHDGPSGAYVEHVDVFEEEPERLHGFRIL